MTHRLPRRARRRPRRIAGVSFPLRIVIPRLLGYKSAKYVQRVELTDHAVEGYWVARGYPYDAEVDPSRLREGKY